MPVPMIGGFDMHLRGGSHFPENPPRPPQVSPSVRAQSLQHLEEKYGKFLKLE